MLYADPMFTSEFDNFWYALIGHKSNPSSLQSNLQWYFSRFSILLCIVLFSESYLATRGVLDQDVSIVAAIMFSVIALTFILWVILLPPFTLGKDINALRFFGNTIISTTLLVGVFSLWYRTYGIEPKGSPLDTLYFSAVTFSTLGFGDFSPEPKAQVFAAIQAILGNLHLGFIVGATLFAASKG